MVLRYRGLDYDTHQQAHAMSDVHNVARRSSQSANINESTKILRYRGLAYTR